MNSIIEKWKNTNLEDNLNEVLNSYTDEELKDAFYKDLEFGTGGMRGVIGAGTNRMNIYTLRKANYGYGLYLKEVSEKDVKVVIAYDCRHKSYEFALESARTLAYLGIKSYVFKRITPTPLLSYAVRYLNACGGIVVTASHNPPKYNGYKIYDNKGCQLTVDKAQRVIDLTNTDVDMLTLNLLSVDDYIKQGLIEFLNDDVDISYLNQVKTVSVNNDINKDNFKVVFTPLHGTSAYLAPKLLEEMGYSYVLVKEQMVSDPNFSTVILPNPEDKRAFDLSIKYAKEVDADICVATDPDADRVGVACKHNGEYHLLNGNQTGAILIYYLVNNRKIDKKGVIFNTIVTSPLGAKIGNAYGLESFSTLTGFKFIGEQAEKLENDNEKMFYFGYEESYGYVIKDFVRDKDSLQALLLCSEVACYYKNKNMTLVDVLEEIYQKFGYYIEDLVNIELTGEKGEKTIKKILDYFRYNDLDQKIFNISIKEDYLLSVKTDVETLKQETLTLPKSNVIKYILKDGSFFVLRPSGTEPKMKLYISCVQNSKEETLQKIQTLKTNIMNIINVVGEL